MKVHQIEEIIVIGSGNWGLALAVLFANRFPVRVWTVDAKMAEHLRANRQAPGHFFSCPIPESIVIEEKFGSPLDEQRALVVIAVPSGQMQSVAGELGRHASRPLVVSVSKGFNADQQCTMSEVIRREIPEATVIVLSGPTIAREVAEGKPTRAVLAGKDLSHLALVKEALHNDVIFFEVSPDPAHHELCAALKGLVAIAVGMADRLALGANAQGVIMMEGIQEMGQVLSFFGVHNTVAYGCSGAADLIATCISPNSRNRRLGGYFAEGLGLQEALDKVGMTVEGVAMSQTIETLWSLNVSIPLINMVNSVLLGRHRDVTQELIAVISGTTMSRREERHSVPRTLRCFPPTDSNQARKLA